jgi:hypothetical protein
MMLFYKKTIPFISYDGHVVFDLKTKNNIVFEEVPASRVYSTREEAQGALNELVNILKQ